MNFVPSNVSRLATRELARRVRIDCLTMTSRSGGSHIGSCLSIADILSVLYSTVMLADPQRPELPERDRFILSKGHAGAAVYAILAEMGFFSKELLNTHYEDGSKLSGHVSHKGVPGVELSTGSLGHGLPVGTGRAYALKQSRRSSRVFVLMSDGECDEGSNWEAILFAAHHRLDNLIAIIDYNKIQSLGSVESTLRLEPFADKWSSFGWRVVEVDGHDHEKLATALDVKIGGGGPTVVIAHTVKGRGVSFMEGSVLWHYRSAKGSEFEAALEELREAV